MKITTHPHTISASANMRRDQATRRVRTIPILLVGITCAFLLYLVLTEDVFKLTSTRYSAALAGVSAWIYVGLGLVYSRRTMDLLISLGFAGTLFFVAIQVMEQTSAAIAPLFFAQAAWISKLLSTTDAPHRSLLLAWGGFNAAFGTLLLCNFL